MSKGKLLAIVCVWLVVIGVAAGVWKLFVSPSRQRSRDNEIKQAEAQKEKDRRAREQSVINNTIATSRYDREINFAIDSFGGFSILRSDKFQEELAKYKIKLNLIDDGADYSARIKNLKTGKVDMGVFTVDALISKSVGETVPPATIVALVDETRGADAMLAYKDVFPNVNALNSPDVKFVAAQGPSENLVRVMMYNFQLPNLSKDPFLKKADGKPFEDAKEVWDYYRKAKPDEKLVYVLWEPFVTKMLDNPNVQVLVDSSRFRGYIVDSIVVGRDFLAKNPDVVRIFVECYFRSLFVYREDMARLVLDDAKKTATVLNEREAQRFVAGTWFKNTSENFSHFGVIPNTGIQHIEDIIANITKVLASSETDFPTRQQLEKIKPNFLYCDGILKKMAADGFHPGVEKVRNDQVALPALTDEQWKKLAPVGTLSVPPLVFARGSDTLTDSSVQTLDELIEKLKTWGQFYVVVQGNATTQGDMEANIKLADDRAKAATAYLVGKGIDPNRIRSVGAKPTDQTSVTFTLGQMPY